MQHVSGVGDDEQPTIGERRHAPFQFRFDVGFAFVPDTSEPLEHERILGADPEHGRGGAPPDREHFLHPIDMREWQLVTRVGREPCAAVG